VYRQLAQPTRPVVYDDGKSKFSQPPKKDDDEIIRARHHNFHIPNIIRRRGVGSSSTRVVEIADPFTLKAGTGSFLLTGDGMTPIVSFAMPVGSGAFTVTSPGPTNLTPPAGSLPTTFDPAKVSTICVLSNGNLTLEKTGSDGGNADGSRAARGQSSGKRYFTAVKLVEHASLWFGIVNASSPMDLFDVTNTDVCMAIGGGTIYFGGSPSGTTYPPFVNAGDVGEFAIDLTAKKVWIRTSPAGGAGGLWNNTAGHDPGTNTGGLTITLSGSGPWYPAMFIGPGGGGYKWTANFGASAFTAPAALPAGFSIW
jgi:hypothetical protein